MTLEQLRIFIAVAEKQHMTQAATQLNLTQSASSAAVAALESRYDVKLFNRVGRGITLTHAGRQFLEQARAVVARATVAAQVLHDLAGLKHGTLSIAASQTVGNYWLPLRMSKFRTAYPGITIKLTIANTEQVATQVHNGTADLGFVEGEVSDPLIESQEIPGDSMIVVVGKKHPWAKQKKVSPQDLLNSKWVLRERGSGTRSMFESALRKFGIDPGDLRTELELPTNESIRSAVAHGDGATAISDLVVTQMLKAHTLTHVKIALPSRPFYILRHKEHYRSKAEDAFIEKLDVI